VVRQTKFTLLILGCLQHIFALVVPGRGFESHRELLASVAQWVEHVKDNLLILLRKN